MRHQRKYYMILESHTYLLFKIKNRIAEIKSLFHILQKFLFYCNMFQQYWMKKISLSPF